MPSVSGDPHTRPPRTSPSQQEGREYSVRLADFYFRRSFWLCQDRLEHNLGWNRASGGEKERGFPRVVFSSASKKSETVRFPSLFLHRCPSRMQLISEEHNVTFGYFFHPILEKESHYLSPELGCPVLLEDRTVGDEKGSSRSSQLALV